MEVKMCEECGCEEDKETEKKEETEEDEE